VLAHQVERAVRLRADVDDARGVLRLELRENAGFTTEALDLLVVSGAREEQLDDHPLVELDVERLDLEGRRAGEDGAYAVLARDHVSRMDLVRAHVRSGQRRSIRAPRRTAFWHVRRSPPR
jgi:hypothetical protein